MLVPRLLSNIETILVRATVVRDMEEAMLKKVEMMMMMKTMLITEEKFSDES